MGTVVPAVAAAGAATLAGGAGASASPALAAIGQFATSALGRQVGKSGRKQASRFSYENRKIRAIEREQVARLQQGKLGPSRAARRQQLGAAVDALQGQAAEERARIARRGGATVASGRSGTALAQQGALQRAQQVATAKAASGIEAVAAQQADAQRREILGLLTRERAARAGYFQGGVSPAAQREVATKLSGFYGHTPETMRTTGGSATSRV